MMGEILSAIASVLILSSTFPQFYHTLKTRLTRDLSIKFLTVCVAGQTAWTVYAIYVNQPVFIVGEGLDTVLWATILVIAIMNFRNRFI